MKNSIYNTLISITKNSDILYNSYSNTFLVIASEVSKHLGEPVFIKSQWKNLYKELIKNEFYVSDRVDEFERLKQKAYQIATFDKSFFLIINPTLDCNLRCWYCYENHVQGSVMEESMQQRVKLLIEQICKSSIESFTLGFFGGEPLMKYNSIVRPLIEFTQKICEEHHIHFNTTFTSNGTLLNANIIQQLTSFSPVSFQITLDGDEECHNKVRFSTTKKELTALLWKISEFCSRINVM